MLFLLPEALISVIIIMFTERVSEMIKGAIFDMDGTLLDSMYYWNNLAEIFVKSLGVEVKEPMPKYIEGKTYRETIVENVRKYFPDMSYEDIIEGCFEHIKVLYRTEIQPKKGAVEFLQKLQSMGVRICMATATDKEFLIPALERLDMMKYFERITTCSEVGIGKSDPLIFRDCLEFLGTEKEYTYIFEDALYAIKTAKADNFKVCGIYDENEKEQDEIKALSDIYVTDYEEFWENI